jgi:hypothetical protein
MRRQKGGPGWPAPFLVSGESLNQLGRSLRLPWCSLLPSEDRAVSPAVPDEFGLQPANRIRYSEGYPEVPHEGAPHALVVAEPGPLRHLDHSADFPALEQQPRGLTETEDVSLSG